METWRVVLSDHQVWNCPICMSALNSPRFFLEIVATIFSFWVLFQLYICSFWCGDSKAINYLPIFHATSGNDWNVHSFFFADDNKNFSSCFSCGSGSLRSLLRRWIQMDMWVSSYMVICDDTAWNIHPFLWPILNVCCLWLCLPRTALLDATNISSIFCELRSRQDRLIKRAAKIL